MASTTPENCPFHLGDLHPPSNAWFSGHTRVFIHYGMSIGSAIFAQCIVECPITLQWAAMLSPKKLPLPLGDRVPHLTHGTYGPPESLTQTAS